MRVDQFESVFRSADKEPYQYERIDPDRILVVTDLAGDPAAAFMAAARRLLATLGDGPNWSTLGNDDYTGVESLLAKVRAAEPDLIVTYRCLRSDSWKWPYTLGEHLDVLTQIIECPVVVAPHPEAGRASAHAMENTDSVMAITDHLTGDHRLINFAARLTQARGTLFLAHIEDERAFEHAINTISKIDSIETDPAREAIQHQLLKEPADYIKSCRAVLKEHDLSISLDAHVGMGYRIAEYRRLITEHEVDLLVMNTRDDDQLAMHGLAYPLAIGLRETPLLLL